MSELERKLENMLQDRNSLARDMVNIHWALSKILDLTKTPETPEKENDVCEAISDLYFRVGMWVEWAEKNDVINKKSDQLIPSAPFAQAEPVIKTTNG